MKRISTLLAVALVSLSGLCIADISVTEKDAEGHWIATKIPGADGQDSGVCESGCSVKIEDGRYLECNNGKPFSGRQYFVRDGAFLTKKYGEVEITVLEKGNGKLTLQDPLGPITYLQRQ